MSTPSPTLFIRLPNWVGDVCMCLPALQRLQAAGYSLTLCGKAWAQDLLAGLNPTQFIALSGKLKSDMTRLRKAQSCGQLGVVFTNSFSSALLFKLAGIKSAGYQGDARKYLLRWSYPKIQNHEVEVFDLLAQACLLSWQHTVMDRITPKPLRLPLLCAHYTQATQAKKDAQINGAYVLLAPNAVGLHKGKVKAWPHFAQLTTLIKTAGYLPVICPPPNELAQAQAAAPEARVISALNLGAFAALLQEASLVICNDSGTAHVAAAVAAKQITLFGVTQMQRTGPWTDLSINLGSASAWPSVEQVNQVVLQQLRSAKP